MNRRWSNGWVKALFALVFIAVPAFVGYIFFLPDWSNAGQKYDLWFYWVVAIGFIIYALGFSFILIYFDILGVDSLAFNIPLAIVLAIIFVTFPWGHGGWWALRALMVILGICTAWPINTIIYNWQERKIINNKK